MKTQTINQTPVQHKTPIVSAIAPARVVRGFGILADMGETIARFGSRPLVVGGEASLVSLGDRLNPVFTAQSLNAKSISYRPDCSESTIEALQTAFDLHQADFVIATGGGKSLDAAKLIAFKQDCPIVTIPSCGATCAAWTALSNIYTDEGAFRYDVGLFRCPDLLILDYELVLTAPKRTLVAGIGDAIAKWYEASVSSGSSTQTFVMAAVNQAKVLHDLLLDQSIEALENPGSDRWCEVVDATVLLAGVSGGIGGAQCRTVAAHAVHNGLTQLHESHGILHGEKVAFGILVQLRLEEMVQGKDAGDRLNLLEFYTAIGLPMTLQDLGLGQVLDSGLLEAAEFACKPGSDIHHLPFPVNPQQVFEAMKSTIVRR
jgi:glycerol dehydrogenase-like iron-containing ADH family enzyme